MTREWPWMFRWDGASVGASPRVSWGGEASDGASRPKMQEGEVRDGTSSWEFQGV